MFDVMILAAEEGGGNFIRNELSVVLLLTVAAAVAVAVRRVRLPYTVALVLVGLVFAFFPDFIDLDIGADVILGILVPPLLFEATLHLNWKKLKRDLAAVLITAIGGTLIGTFIVAGIVKPMTGIPWIAAITFGALISATDPVAVIAFFKELGVSKRLTILVEGESLFNDGVAIVLFNLAIAAAASGMNPSVGEAFGEFLLVAFGGLIVGLVLGYIVSTIVLANLDDHLIETVATLAVAYGSYLVAESFGTIIGVDDFHVSGILATVAAGLVVGNVGMANTSPTTRRTLENFWEFLSFLVNSMVFLIIGIRIDLSELSPSAIDIVVAIVAILVARFVVIYGLGLISNLVQSGNKVPMSYKHVAFWGGLRGAISLALALSVTEKAFEPDVVETVQIMTFGVVLFTLLCQGTTMTPLISRLGLSGQAANETRQQRLQARLYTKQAGRDEIARLESQGILFPAMASSMMISYDDEIQTDADELGTHYRAHPELETSMLLQARRDAMVAEQTSIADMTRRGLISSDVAEDLAVELDNRMEALSLIEERWERAPLRGDNDE